MILYPPLVQGLSTFTKLYSKKFSPEYLTEGLPIDHLREGTLLHSFEGSDSLFSRMAHRAGLHATLLHKELDEISSLHTPALLVLHNQECCILESIDHQKQEAKIIYPQQEIQQERVSFKKLNKEYTQSIIVLKEEYQYEEEEIHPRDLSKNWLKETLMLSKHLYRDALIASFFINLFVLATPLFVMNVYDRVIPNNATETLIMFSLGVVFVFILDLILKFLRSYFLEVAAKKSDLLLSSFLFERLMGMKMQEMPSSIGAYANRVKNFEYIKSFFASATLAILIDFPFVLLFLFAIYLIGSSLVFIPILTIAVIFAYLYISKEKLSNTIGQIHATAARKNGVLVESLYNLETLKSQGMTSLAQYKWERLVHTIATKNLKTKMILNASPAVIHFLGNLNVVGVIFLGVLHIYNHQLSMGALIAVMILSSRALAPAGNIGSLLAGYKDAKTSYYALESLLKKEQERTAKQHYISRNHLRLDIEFQNVSFSYPKSSVKALDNVSFTIQEGEKVALIGRVGCGKSTIAKLLLQLYAPSEGKILIGGVDISQIDPAELRKKIGYLPQEIELFEGTLRSNILRQYKYVSDDWMLRCTQVACIDTFIHTHPRGYEMHISDGAKGLSGGQKQGVALARALISDAPLLLLDEPSNAMDQTTEGEFVAQLQEFAQEKTLLVSTHRTSVLELVDRVLVFHNGALIHDDSKEKIARKIKGKA